MPTVPVLRDERCGRRDPDGHGGGQLAGRGLGEHAVGAEDLLGAGGVPQDQTASDRRADRVQQECEPSDHAEVAAAAPQRPEQLCVDLAIGGADRAVGGDDLHLVEVVDGPAEAAHQVAETAAEGQAGDADLGDESEHGRQAVPLRGAVDVLEQAAGSDMDTAGGGVDGDIAHPGQIEGQTLVGEGGAGDVVPTAFDAQQQPVVAGELHGYGDVAGGDRLNDERRSPGRQGVPHQHGTIPALVAGAEQAALDP